MCGSGLCGCVCHHECLSGVRVTVGHTVSGIVYARKGRDLSMYVIPLCAGGYLSPPFFCMLSMICHWLLLSL